MARNIYKSGIIMAILFTVAALFAITVKEDHKDRRKKKRS